MHFFFSLSLSLWFDFLSILDTHQKKMEKNSGRLVYMDDDDMVVVVFSWLLAHRRYISCYLLVLCVCVDHCFAIILFCLCVCRMCCLFLIICCYCSFILYSGDNRVSTTQQNRKKCFRFLNLIHWMNIRNKIKSFFLFLLEKRKIFLSFFRL